MAKNEYKEWQFDFVLSSQDGEPFTVNKPAELMSVAAQWAENNNMMVGGGMRPIKEETEMIAMIAELIERKENQKLRSDEMIKFDDDRILTIQQIQDILTELVKQGKLQPLVDQLSMRTRDDVV